MESYQIITDTTIDMPQQLIEDLGVQALPLTFEIAGRNYHHYLDERELPLDDFYKMIKAGEFATTSQINIQVFQEAFRHVLEQGQDVLYLAFSSGLSGTYQSSMIAKSELQDEYPDRKIICVDTLCASCGEGLMIYLAAKKKKEGVSIDELAAWVEENRYHICTWYTVDDLIHLKRGGRISAVSATFGTALSIKPVMTVDNDGKLVVKDKVRGRKKSLLALVDHVKNDQAKEFADTVVITHAADEEAANFMADKIKEECHVTNVIITKMGPIIGAHTGAGAAVVAFFGGER
ncbi:DegV family protein [Lachnospiraceae bacterium KM106-2]|nr:DegV family protein [Lachnospiraceae bacterium KM106-2]